MEFSTEYQHTEPIAEFYGELEDFIMVRLNEGRVQIRKIKKESESDEARRLIEEALLEKGK